MQTADLPKGVIRAQGSRIFLDDGRSLIDAISSWWVNLHGHAHPKIAEAIYRQSLQLEHVLFAGYTHRPAVDFAERLLQMLPGRMAKIFYSDNGSTAVETAIKMAIGYERKRTREKPRILCLEGGYHGDTFGAMSSSGKNCFNRPFWSYLFQSTMVKPPYAGFEEEAIESLKAALRQDQYFAFIYEPAILGAGGMRTYSLDGFATMLSLIKDADITLIADEVMTGFGRTGPLFASELIGVKPDIICLSKGISGGFLPFAATACTEEIFNAFLSDRSEEALLHGHSYTANPLACSAAIASLDLLLSDSCKKRRAEIQNSHKKAVSQWRGDDRFKRVESIGTILVVEYKNSESTHYFHPLKELIHRYFEKKGILVRPLGNTLYIMPPYCISDDELNHIYQTLEETRNPSCLSSH